MDLEQLLKELSAQFAKDRQAVFTALHAHAQPVFQMVLDRGRREERKKLAESVTQKEARITELEGELSELETKLENASKGQPDLQVEVTKLKDQLKAAKTAHEAEVVTLKAANDEAEIKRALGEVEKQLVAKGMKPLYAKNVVRDEDFRKRVKRVNGQIEVLQAGSDSDPYAPADGQSVIDLVVGELWDAADADEKVASADRGADTRNGQGASGGGTGKGDKLSQLKTRLEEQRKNERTGGSVVPIATSGLSLEQKLGMAPTPAA